MSGSNGTAPTAAAEWGTADVETVTLPSGNSAQLKKKLNIWSLVRSGAMSQEMVAAFDKAAAGQLDDLDMAVQLNDAILEAMFVEPEVFVPDDEDVDQPDGSLHVDQIDDADIEFVLNRAFGGAREAAAFRGDGDGSGDGADGEGVGQGAKRAARGGAGKSGGARAGQRARSSTR
jgi:hypothetical protein